MQVKSRAAKFGKVAELGNGDLGIRHFLNQVQKAVLDKVNGVNGPPIGFPWLRIISWQNITTLSEIRWEVDNFVVVYFSFFMVYIILILQS